MKAGLSKAAIDAAWPSWWSEEAAHSASAKAELRFALSRRLGLSPKALLGERVEFIWKNEARFKSLTAQDELAQAALASFGMTLGRALLRATQNVGSLGSVSAIRLRGAILAGSPVVDLKSLIATCWAVGIPVIYLRVFPLDIKAMHAMIVRHGGRYAVLIGREASYPAPVAFTLAHEIAHAALNHLDEGAAIVDMDDAAAHPEDNQEQQANRYALALLTGQERPSITTSRDRFGARSLAAAVLTAGPQRSIDPGALALCLGYDRDVWAVAIGALRHIYKQPSEIWKDVNAVAASQLDWDRLDDESSEYLRRVMGANE